jgi:14-3-3 protein epsilon
LIDRKLLPSASDAISKVFSEKLKGDDDGRLVEFKADPDRREGADKAIASYESALAIATAELGKAEPIYLGLIINYSLFLYEIIGQRTEAFE